VLARTIPGRSKKKRRYPLPIRGLGTGSANYSIPVVVSTTVAP